MALVLKLCIIFASRVDKIGKSITYILSDIEYKSRLQMICKQICLTDEI